MISFQILSRDSHGAVLRFLHTFQLRAVSSNGSTLTYVSADDWSRIEELYHAALER